LVFIVSVCQSVSLSVTVYILPVRRINFIIMRKCVTHSRTVELLSGFAWLWRLCMQTKIWKQFFKLFV